MRRKRREAPSGPLRVARRSGTRLIPQGAVLPRDPPPPVTRVLVATDGTERATRAVAWAADMAERYGAELLLLRVLAQQAPRGATRGIASADATQAAYVATDLARLASMLAGDRGRSLVVVAEDPAAAIVAVGEEEGADVIVVSNENMRGRREFLVTNVPNRVSHSAQCTVVIVDTGAGAR